MTSHFTSIGAHLVLILMVSDQISINCIPSGEEQSDAIRFLEQPVKIPVGINNEIVNRVRNILKRYENQIFELRTEINDCETVKYQPRCSNINTKLEDTKRNLRNDLNNMRLRILTSFPTSNNLLTKFFDRMYNVFRDYVLHINFQFSITKTPSTGAPTDAPSGGSTGGPDISETTEAPVTEAPVTEAPETGEPETDPPDTSDPETMTEEKLLSKFIP